jgi:triacylglycerol esterase/lipase EstA (alpha/beta hydrolase family)
MRLSPRLTLGDLAPRRRIVIAAALAVVVVGVAMIVLRLAGSADGARPTQSRPGSVLLVPGYGGSTGSLSALADRIRATGRTATVVALPGDGTGDLQAQAAALDKAVGDALAHTPGGSVDVVGYSAGGVVVRLWVARFQGEDRARRVVTLGAPLHGARVAAAGSAFAPDACPVACQQLVPGSSLLTELEGDKLPAGLPWLSVWTVNDQTVQPPESARLAGAVNVVVQDVCADARVAHGQLPTDPLVTGLVLRALGAAPLTAPTAADCAALRVLGR